MAYTDNVIAGFCDVMGSDPEVPDREVEITSNEVYVQGYTHSIICNEPLDAQFKLKNMLATPVVGIVTDFERISLFR